MTAEYDLRYQRTGFDPDGIYSDRACTLPGHVEGCPGKTGGEHELREGWVAIPQDDETVLEVEVA